MGILIVLHKEPTVRKMKRRMARGRKKILIPDSLFIIKEWIF